MRRNSIVIWLVLIGILANTAACRFGASKKGGSSSGTTVVTPETDSSSDRAEPSRDHNKGPVQQPPAPGELDALESDSDIDITDGDEAWQRQNTTEFKFVTKKTRWVPGMTATPAETPILTGGKTQRNHQFTDSHDDDVMAFLVARFNQLPKKLKGPSRRMAENIYDVRVRANVLTRKTYLDIGFFEGDERVHVGFSGQLDSRRHSHLDQITSSRQELKFSAEMACIDTTTFVYNDITGYTCENTVVRLEQWRNGQLCRVVYIVHRFGDAHIWHSEQVDEEYDSFENDNQREFARFLSNTTYNARMNIENSPERAYPAAHTFGLKTWAVAYGQAGFSLEIASAWPQDPDHPPVSYKSMTRFVGPLLTMGDNTGYDRNIKVTGEYSASENKRHTQFAKGIDSASLVGNDGRGLFNFGVTFKGSPKSSLRLNVVNLVNLTMDYDELQDTLP